MKVAIAYNSYGAKLAESIKSYLSGLEHDIFDFGVTEGNLDDADIAYAACKELSEKHIDRAILLCGAGQCTCIVANKINGLYAAACNDVFEARQARQRYDTNVLCLPVRWLDTATAGAIVKEWLITPFHNSRRNGRSLEKIRAIEKGLCPT
ncbi:MAG: RpiB/LacA/LacB family sugar-phosphate isomerase [Planctomycetota bacterium]